MCICPQLDAELGFENGDVLVVMANTVEYCLTEIIEDRFAIISTTKGDNSTLQNVAFEDDPVELPEAHRTEEGREKKADEDRLRRKIGKELIRAYHIQRHRGDRQKLDGLSQIAAGYYTLA
jgi:hypothetical protein